ncbi:MAG: CoA-binding protein [Promethearchaeota archaeon]
MSKKNENSNFLDFLFKPKTIAIYGASEKSKHFIGGLKIQGFNKNKIYLINPSKEELFGLKVYKSLKEIPEDAIDHLIITIRREKLVESLKEIFSQKKINTIHIFTAGTGEFDEKGLKIEKEIKIMLDQGKLKTRIIGPNCMGCYCPKGHMAYLKSFPKKSGNIGLIFQSGDLHTRLIKFGNLRYDLRFSKGVSIGNTLDLQVSEVLDYFNNDEETDIIAVYFEGFSTFHPNEGKNLLKTLKTMKKPVLFMRGGETKRGQTAVLTHTGTIGTKQRIWDAIFKQTSIIKVPTSLDSILDYIYIFYMFINRYKKLGYNFNEIPYPTGKNTLLILWSGGFGILATDTLTKLGLNLPIFKGEILEKLRKIFPIKIGSFSNPLDLPWIESSKEYLEISKATISENIDLVIIETDVTSNFKQSKNFKAYYSNINKIKEFVESLNKVLILILYQYPSPNRKEYYDMLIKDGFIVYPTLPQAAKAYLALYGYGVKVKSLKNKQMHN